MPNKDWSMPCHEKYDYLDEDPELVRTFGPLGQTCILTGEIFDTKLNRDGIEHSINAYRGGSGVI